MRADRRTWRKGVGRRPRAGGAEPQEIASCRLPPSLTQGGPAAALCTRRCAPRGPHRRTPRRVSRHVQAARACEYLRCVVYS